MLNPLTGYNTSPLMAPRMTISDLWYFKSIYTSQRDYLKEVATSHALGELVLVPSEHRALIADLRRMHSITKRLEATVDAIYQPIIDKVMAEPDRRYEPKVIPLRHRVPPPPKRKRGRPKGSKNRKKQASTITTTVDGVARITHPDGTVVKRRRVGPVS